MFRGRIKKFIVIPVLSVEDENGDTFREERCKPFEAFIGNLPNLKQVAEHHEAKYEREFFTKLNAAAAKSGRSSRIRGSGK